MTAGIPRVSVVMPVLNPHPVYFRHAVESILTQTLGDLELVIIEEPGERGGREILAELNDDRIRHLVHPHRTSLVEQRNRGLAEARSDVVALLDADDIMRPDRLAKQVAFLESHPDVDVLGSQLEIIDAGGRTIGYRWYPEEYRAIVRALRYYNPVAQPAVICRRQVLLDAGGYQYSDHPAVEDYELWCRLAERGVRFANHAEALLKYRVHPEGMKTAKLRGILRGTLAIKERYFGRTMDVRGRLRMWGERALLWLPPGWVLRLFMTMTVSNASKKRR